MQNCPLDKKVYSHCPAALDLDKSDSRCAKTIGTHQSECSIINR